MGVLYYLDHQELNSGFGRFSDGGSSSGSSFDDRIVIKVNGRQ